MRFALTVSAFNICLLSSAADWPQFRGPTGDGHAVGVGYPMIWSEKENILWKTAIHDKGWSSPVIWGEQIWLTTAKEDGTELYAVCLDRATGKILHDVKLFTVKNPPDVKKYNSFASPTPAMEEGRVYVHYGSLGTACLDTKTAKVLWNRDDLPCNHFRGAASSPILFDKKLHLTFDGFDKQYAVALDCETGKTNWLKDRNIKYKNDNGDYKKAFATPSVFEIDGQPQLISPAAEQTIAYDPRTGDELWRVSHGGMNEACKPVLTHGLIILSSGHTANVVAVKSGVKGELGKESITWEYPRQGPTKPSVLAVGDHVYCINDSGIASCLVARTGKPVWMERIRGTFSSSPTWADNKIYIAAEGGVTGVIAAPPRLDLSDATAAGLGLAVGSGVRTKPGFEILAENKLAAGCRATPAFVDGKIYLRTDTHLYCIGSK